MISIYIPALVMLLGALLVLTTNNGKVNSLSLWMWAMGLLVCLLQVAGLKL